MHKNAIIVRLDKDIQLQYRTFFSRRQNNETLWI